MLARAVITAGGIGTIVAVLGVLVFLVAVTAPLFQSATLAQPRLVDIPLDADTTVIAVGADESGHVAWTLADDGALRVVSTTDGSLLAERAGSDTGLAGVRVARPFGPELRTVFAFADGFALGRVGLESSFVSVSDLPPAFRDLAVGEAAFDGEAVIVHQGDGHFDRLLIVTVIEERRPLGESGVTDVDATMLTNGPLVAALGDDGSVRIESLSQRRNLLTDEVVTEAVGTTLTLAKRDGNETPLRFVRVSELGDQVFLIREDGQGQRHEIRSIDAPREMERFALCEGETQVTTVARLFGGNALAVGDRSGVVTTWFLSRPQADSSASEPESGDGLRLRKAVSFPSGSGGPAAESAAITGLAGSPRSRLFATTDAAGRLRLLHSTSGRVLTSKTLAPAAPAGLQPLAIGPRENELVTVSGSTLQACAFSAGYPEVSASALFGKVWYENYPEPAYVWETTGHESFEPKYGLVPLVFGTIKATLYSMFFAVPIALLAAVYSSQFMQPAWKARIKPTIEMMASLPSVVLGFVAGLVFAPLLEQRLAIFLTSCLTVPLSLLLGAHLWQLMPSSARTVYQWLRFPVVLLLTIPCGLFAGTVLGPLAENLFFGGDLHGWLDGRDGNGSAGWAIAMLPLSGLVVAIGFDRLISPVLRERSGGWSSLQAGVVSISTFVLTVAAALALAMAAGVLLDAFRLDTRGGIFGTYVQRNAMVVGIGMSFAIIPLIFTIADDALSSVPEHLRSASLGAGATPWQTAIRVIVPAASGGIFSAVMIGLGRAVGETMIVLMAAGNTPLLKWNIFNGFQTLSAALATELPEAARGTAHYRVLFLAALTLFAMTFVVNTIAEIVRQRVRRRSNAL
jgi:phosphate transport system permease protein